jgi:hypothetical protein
MTTRQTLFILTFAFIVGHELDAMTHHEWRLLPALNFLDEEAGRAAFVAIHVPLIVLLLWLNARGGWIFHAAFGAFCAIHVGLHWWFEPNPFYTFKGPLSYALIWGAGLAGALLALHAVKTRVSGLEL